MPQPLLTSLGSPHTTPPCFLCSVLMHFLPVPPARQTHSYLRAFACMGSPFCLESSFPSMSPHLPPVHHSDRVPQDALPDPIHTHPASLAPGMLHGTEQPWVRICRGHVEAREGEDSYSCRVENTACGSLVP